MQLLGILVPLHVYLTTQVQLTTWHSLPKPQNKVTVEITFPAYAPFSRCCPLHNNTIVENHVLCNGK